MVVTVVLNPLTEAAQRVAPLLMVLRDQLQVSECPPEINI